LSCQKKINELEDAGITFALDSAGGTLDMKKLENKIGRMFGVEKVETKTERNLIQVHFNAWIVGPRDIYMALKDEKVKVKIYRENKAKKKASKKTSGINQEVSVEFGTEYSHFDLGIYRTLFWNFHSFINRQAI
jgi:hypothetical protein